MVRCGELFNPLGPARPPPPGACRPARPGSEDLKSAPRPDAGTVVTSLTRLQLTNNNFHQFESTFYRNRKCPRFWFYRVTARAAFSQLGDGVRREREIRDIPSARAVLVDVRTRRGADARPRPRGTGPVAARGPRLCRLAAAPRSVNAGVGRERVTCNLPVCTVRLVRTDVTISARPRNRHGAQVPTLTTSPSL